LTDSPLSEALGAVRCVRVGSLNAPKIEAVRRAFAPYTEDALVEGVEVQSGVPEQPVGFAEIAAGARGRAAAAFGSGDCELAVGIEDGLVILDELPSEAFNIGCAAVTDGERTALGLSSGFAYPEACSLEALAEREPIGGLFDELWRSMGAEIATPSALSVGNVGKLSLGVLPRAEYARHAVLCALIRFLHPALYFGADSGAVAETGRRAPNAEDRG
jgi:inosine/xanthosine triphosphatase